MGGMHSFLVKFNRKELKATEHYGLDLRAMNLLTCSEAVRAMTPAWTLANLGPIGQLSTASSTR